MTTRPMLGAAALCALGTTAAYAQVASALLHEGDALPTVSANVSSISNTAVNQAGGYAITLNDDASISHVWGAANTVDAPGILRTEATIMGLTQTSFEGFFGIADGGQLSYSASGTGGPVGGFDSVWLDDTPIAVEGDPTGFDANFWRFASRPGVTAGGEPYFVAGVTSTSGGSTENRGLYYGNPALPVMQGGDLLPGMPFALTTASAVDFDVRYSANGTHVIAPVQIDTGSGATDGAMSIDAAGLIIGGTLVQEGTLLPASAGGDGVENWDNFDFCGITEAGNYFFTGDTDGDVTADEFVLVNGLITLREGDTVDGRVLAGAIESAYMNEAAGLAIIWDVETMAGTAEALIVNGSVVLEEGSLVDWNGDGIIDAGDNGAFVDNFTGISSLTFGSLNVAYFTADCDVGGVVLEGFFALGFGDPPISSYCHGDGSLMTPCPCGNDTPSGSGQGCMNSTGQGAQLSPSGSASVANDDLQLTVSGTAANQNGIVFSGINGIELPFGDGLRCAGDMVFRFPIRMADNQGSYTETPIASVLGVAAGDTRFIQGWYRDPVNGPCGTGFNLTNGLRVEFQP